MNTNIIQVQGVTSSQDYPSFPLTHPCKQVSQTDNLYIPCQKPDMKDIIEVIVSLSIASFKVISTIQGDKLIIDGLKHIKILYTADNDSSSVHSAHFDMPFCEFILLKSPCSKVVCIQTAIEHIAAHQMSCREFAISIVILLCPVFEKSLCHIPSQNTCHGSSWGRCCCLQHSD